MCIRDRDTPEYAEAIDTFNAANGYQLEPKAKKILKGLAFREMCIRDRLLRRAPHEKGSAGNGGHAQGCPRCGHRFRIGFKT